jgi:hypothetical protein
LSKAKTTPRTLLSTEKEWVKWRNEDPESFDDRYELCEEGPAMLRIPTSEAGTETDRDTVKLPRESERKSLVDLNPELFPPMRSTMGSVDLAMLDEFGSKKPYK